MSDWHFRFLDHSSRIRLHIGAVSLTTVDGPVIDQIADLARAGIHPASYMPFSTPWSAGSPQDVQRNIKRWMTASIEKSHIAKWNLIFGVRRNGVLVGSTNLSASNYSDERTVTTGSWLGQDFQGVGTGKLMRAALLQLAFGELGAEFATSEVFADNFPSRAVNEHLGYVDDGERTVTRQGSPTRLKSYRLSRHGWLHMADVNISGGKEMGDFLRL
ncbi:GNAT family N-acetyltransferase [Streptomyces nojiriensis]|uniref:GNAT family N-acetyltransferase n=1 Tax=Streptomyces nojiriensis TaxID=66374 RepID=UPI0036653DE1